MSNEVYKQKLAGKKILVTGGTGYIGSHTVVELLACDAEVYIIDSLINSHIEVLNRLKTITGKTVNFEKVDLVEMDQLSAYFSKSPKFDACIHFAGLKAVGESVNKPLYYYSNNITGSLNLLKLLGENGCYNLVFSSSATVYGMVETNPIPETSPLSTTNPYGATKLMTEMILKDLAHAESKWRIALLRYFNPVGAHPSGLIGEDPNGTPNNLLPFVTQVAVGKHPRVNIFGNDYPTPDGTGVRDYIHVVDLAKGHLASLTHAIFGSMISNCEAYNLGTGIGYSVLDVLKATEKAAEKSIPYQIVARRPGDVATCYADPTKANKELQWSTQYALQEAVNDSWRWQKNNPDGFKTK